MLAALVSSAMLIGGLPVPALVLSGALAVASGLLAFQASRGYRRVFRPALVPLGLCLFCVAQTVPLPKGFARLLSPKAVEVAEGASRLLGQSPPSLVPLSADVGATIVEALRWLAYACVIVAAIAASSRRTHAWVGLALFVSAAAVGAVTFAHGLLGLTRVFGLFTPTFVPTRWHTGPLLNPNNFSGYLNLGLFSGAGLFISGRRRSRFVRLGLAFGVATLMAIVFVAASRAGLVATSLGMVVFVFLARPTDAEREGEAAGRRWRRLLRLGGALVGGGLLVALGATPETWRELFDRNVEKLDVMRHVLPLIRDYPLLGVGRGAFESVFPAYHVGRANVIYAHAENFVVQWIAEWGVPVGVATVVALVWLLARLGSVARRSASAAGMFAGLVALLAQNMLDLALEVPGVMVAACVGVGALWAEAQKDEFVEDRRVATPFAESPWWQRGVAVLGILFVALVLGFGRHGVAKDRIRVRTEFARLDLTDADAASELWSDIRSSVARHPAEPYFARAGALLAWRTRQDPIPWIQRALERGGEVGRTHSVLGDMLLFVGAREQALFEYRLAATYEPNLIVGTSKLVARLARDFDEVLRATPDGEDGGRFLMQVATNLGRGSPDLRRRCLYESMVRLPKDPAPRAALVREVTGLIAAPDGAECGAEAAVVCRRFADEQILEIARIAPDSPTALILKADLWNVSGRAAEAESLLAANCDRYIGEARAQCNRARVRSAFATGSPSVFRTAVRATLDAGCEAGAKCGEFFGGIASLAEGAGDLSLALTLHQKAAEEDSTGPRWLAVSRTAHELGDEGLAIAALGRAAQQSHDPVLQKQYEVALRRTLVKSGQP